MNKPENHYLTIIRGVLPKGFDFKNYDIYFIKGFEMTDHNIELVEQNVHEDSFSKVLNELSYNSQGDNVNVYVFLNLFSKKKEVFLISDPLELYEQEKVIRKYNEPVDKKILSIESVEKVN